VKVQDFDLGKRLDGARADRVARVIWTVLVVVMALGFLVAIVAGGISTLAGHPVP
jgi:hypothetical protein